MGSSQFLESVLAHAMLQIAKRAAEIETPRALQFARIFFVVSRSREIVGTIVRRVPLDWRGNECPPLWGCAVKIMETREQEWPYN